MKQKLPERFRIKVGLFQTTAEAGHNGNFMIPHRFEKNWMYQVMVSDGMGWEHVSVSIYNQRKECGMAVTPTWDDMCYVKDIFFDPEETVIQYHPPRSMYVNNHRHCLHLWRCTLPPPYEGMPIPHPMFVGLIDGFELGEEGKKKAERVKAVVDEVRDRIKEQTKPGL